MRLTKSTVMLDTCAKFFRTLHISGSAEHDQEVLLRIEMLNCNVVAHSFAVEPPGMLWQVRGRQRIQFSGNVFLADDVFPFQAFICFQFSNLQQEIVPLYDLVHERLASSATYALYHSFLQTVSGSEFRRVLDIGGRNRSQIDRRNEFPDHEVTVIDILPGENVDVVCDAHVLTRHISPASFDAIQSVSVFEHVLMPWKLVLEMNRVLRPGGLVYVHTHQSLGIHDSPCDYWRFSMDAWPALFNPKTGFEIVDVAMSHESFLIPHFWRPDKISAEQAVGFEASVVLARKTSETQLSWDVLPDEITDARYPA